MKKTLITTFGLLFLFSCQHDEDLIDEDLLQDKTNISNTLKKNDVDITGNSFIGETTTNNTLLINYKPNILPFEKLLFKHCLSAQLQIDIINYDLCSINNNAEYITFSNNANFHGEFGTLPDTDDHFDEEDSMTIPGGIIEIHYAQLVYAISSCDSSSIVESFSVFDDCSVVEENNDPSNYDILPIF